MLEFSLFHRTDAATVALKRALKVRFETMSMRSQMVEKRIEHEHADALRKIREQS